MNPSEITRLDESPKPCGCAYEIAALKAKVALLEKLLAEKDAWIANVRGYPDPPQRSDNYCPD